VSDDDAGPLQAAQRYWVAAGEAITNQVRIDRYRIASVDPANARRIYINVPQDEEAHHGREVTITAQIDPPAPLKTVYFAALRHGRAGGLELPDANAASLEDTEATTDADGRASVTLVLSTFGGDAVQVGATLAEADRDAFVDGEEGSRERLVWSGRLVTWRKVYLEVDCMRRGSGERGTYASAWERVRPQIEAELARAYLALHTVGRDNRMANRAVLANDEGSIRRYAGGLSSGRRHEPHYAHLVLVDTLVRLPAGAQAEEYTYRLDVTGLRQEIDLGDRVRYAYDNENWLVSGSLRVDGQAAGDLEDGAQLRIRATPDNWYADLDLTGVRHQGRAIDPSRQSVTARIVVRFFESGSGVRVESHAVVGMRPRELSYAGSDNLDKSILKTVVHELGHMFGLTPRVRPDAAQTSLATEPSRGEHAGSHSHPFYLHHGPHCRRNLGGGGNGESCIMYGGAAVTAADAPDGNAFIPTELCDRCLEALRGRILSELPLTYEAGYEPD